MRQMVTIGFVAVIMVAVSANAEPTSPFGAEPIGVVFEDAALSNTTRSSITGDLARLFSFSLKIAVEEDEMSPRRNFPARRVSV